MIVRVLLLTALSLIHGELCADPLTEKAGFASKLIIYLAKGPANSCGTGCDHWIAIEGKVDQDAGSRIRRFLRNVKDTQLPIYFHSPGGMVEQAFVIGRLLVDEATGVLPSSKQRQAGDRVSQPRIRSSAARSASSRT